MTRAKFTQQMWQQSTQLACWQHDTALSLDQATNSWWWNPSLPDHWRLTGVGLYQLTHLPDLNQEFQTWETWCLHSSRINIMLSRLNRPWAIATSSDNNRQIHVCQLMIHGSEANVWMALCGGNLEGFLSSWVDRSL